MTHLNELTITKPCPRCGNDLTVRVDGETGVEVLGCTEHLDCQHTEPLPMSIVVERQGAARLEGL